MKSENKYYVYMMASKRNGTIYTGVSGNLKLRVQQHKDKSVSGFTEKYDVNMLVYYQVFNDVRDAISTEKKIKVWQRKWKIRLIEEMNPLWEDLSMQEGFGLL